MSFDKNVSLKLIGKNQEDLQVISAYLQDSVTSVNDIVYLKKNRSVVMMVNRFMWEDVEKGVFRKNKRIRCAVKFEDVSQVRTKNINQKKKNKILECLAIKCNSTSDGAFKFNIVFAGDNLITVNTEAIEVIMNDLGKPWTVKHIPAHKI